MKITPVGQKILVLPMDAKDEKVGSIVIPSGVATADLSDGEVVEVSPDLEHKYKPGDIVSYPSKSGLAQLYKGKYHLWLREDLGEIWSINTEDE